jgi:hypothetical protein
MPVPSIGTVPLAQKFDPRQSCGELIDVMEAPSTGLAIISLA